MSTIAAGALMAGCLGDHVRPTSPERMEAIMHCPESFDENGWYLAGVHQVSWVDGACQVDCEQGRTLCGGVCLSEADVPHSACDRCQNTCQATWVCVHDNAMRDGWGGGARFRRYRADLPTRQLPLPRKLTPSLPGRDDA